MIKNFALLIRRNLLPFGVLVLSLVLTVVAWQADARFEQQLAREVFNRIAQNYQRMLERRLDTYIRFLDDLGGFVEVGNAISYPDFSAYIEHSHILEHYPGTKRIGYLPRVPAAVTAAHVARMRAEGFTAYRIRADGRQAEYYPYDYLYPFDAGARQGLLGVDEHNEPARRVTLQRARDSGEVVATGRLDKVLVPSKQVSFLLYGPVYQKGTAVRTVDQRRRALKGFVYAAFRAEDLIRAALGEDARRVADLRFWVGPAGAGWDPVYASAPFPATAGCQHCSHYVSRFQAAGQLWTVEFRERPGFYRAQHENNALLVLGSGLFASLLLMAIAILYNQRQQASRVQQEQNQQFRSLFEQNPDAVYSTDLSGRFQNANPTTLRLTGMRLDELRQQPIGRFIAPDCLDASLVRLELAARGIPAYGETALLGPDGERVELSTTELPILVDGKVVGVFGIAKDITQRKHAEEQSRQIRQFLDAIIEHMPAALFVKEAEGLRFIAWNQANERMTGLSRHEVIGRTDYDLFDKEAADQFVRVDREVLDTWRAVDIPEETVHTRHAGVRLLHTIKVPFRMGETRYLLGIAEDITARKQAEAALHKAHAELEARVRERTFALSSEIEARKAREAALRRSEASLARAQAIARLGSWERDLASNRFEVSDETLRIFGVQRDAFDGSFEAFIGCVHPEDRATVVGAYQECLAHNGRYGLDYRIARPDGEERVVHAEAEIVLDQGTPVRLTGTIQDITLRKRAEDELAGLPGHLQAAREEERTRIAREIHDELGGVLAAVKFELSIPMRQGDTDASGPALRNHDLIRLVDSAIVSLRRIMADLRPSVLDDLGLWAALEWLSVEFQSRTGIACAYRMTSEEQEIDPDRATAIFRMVQESLNNVVKHAQATGVSITAAIREQTVIVQVHDNGCGITQSRTPGTKTFGIIGMHERARSFNGQVKISSRRDRGTTVTLIVPVHA